MTLFIIRSSDGTSYKKRSEIRNILSTAGEKKIHNLFTIWFTIKSYSRTVKKPRKEKSIVHYTRKIVSVSVSGSQFHVVLRKRLHKSKNVVLIQIQNNMYNMPCEIKYYSQNNTDYNGKSCTMILIHTFHMCKLIVIIITYEYTIHRDIIL